MAYVYRYIDLDKGEVVYVGKVTKHKDYKYDPLRLRHEQHMREDWYKAGKNIVMQYVELNSHADADILETWLINYYDADQLVNKSKTGWGKCSFDLSSLLFGRWRTFGLNTGSNEDEATRIVSDMVRVLFKYSEGLNYNLDRQIEMMNDQIRHIAEEKRRAYLLSRFDSQEDYKRGDRNDAEGTDQKIPG